MNVPRGSSLRYLAAPAAFLLAAVLSSCASAPEPEPQETLYKAYDRKVDELREAARQGTLTVAEAESKRQEAYRVYRQEAEEKQVMMEYRNY
ncbi:MAG: hypothetical protein FGM27_08610 [Candidatus Omnitrophica bacterium]|nr:hypothetical protein [Candidatus Omnitrophota bacterium]